MVSMNYQVTYTNGDRYVGTVCNTNNGATVPHGYGTKYYVNGDVYTGNFYLNSRHGYGYLQYANGDYYKGNFQSDCFHGQGESFRVREQRRYIGQFWMGFEEGYATITSVDIATRGGNKKYVGFVAKGLRHGQGTQWLTSLNGETVVFSGQWANGLLDGQGTMTTPRQVWSGTFRNGQLEGLGTSVDRSIGVTNQVLFRGGDIAMYVK
jgi:hypothetical protein